MAEKKITNLKECLEIIDNLSFTDNKTGLSLVSMEYVRKYFKELEQSRREIIKELKNSRMKKHIFIEE